MTLIKRLLVKTLKSAAGKYYEGAKLSKAKAASDPITQFADWFKLAKEVDPDFADAMTLSTSTTDGRPSNRLVLLKGFNEDGFVFYTNFNSRKSIELSNNPRASLVFWWKELYRQVRIEGRVEQISDQESDAYFKTRPRGSQLGAWASPQSDTLNSRVDLQKELEKLTQQYQGHEVPRPPFWGGYRLHPEVIEFWQGRSDRLHDRLRYRKQDPDEGPWIIERLAP